MDKINFYRLPAAGEAREALREKGQFWTPDWVAEAMVEYVLSGQVAELFDPAVGAGAFFRAAKRMAQDKERPVTLEGMDIDPAAVEQAIQSGLTPRDMESVKIGDFVFDPPERKLSAIVANPPYIRHHRISVQDKTLLKQIGLQTIGKTLDGRAGLHIYFLVRALSLLEENGKLAFIMPADTCEGKFAPKLWRWIAAHFALDAVITFAPEASPFPNVDTNPIIFFLRRAAPAGKFLWARCLQAQTDALKEWVRSGFTGNNPHAMSVVERDLGEGIATGLSRPPVTQKMSKYVLGDFVQVVRGIATGANDFFFMTNEQAAQTGIPEQYFVRAIGRTRDVPGDEITEETLAALRAKGRPTLLLSLNDDPPEVFPESVRRYLRQGEERNLPARPLISQRKPWYKMESRAVPPFLFAYLGRRNSRFIRNTAKILPLTGFLCIYPCGYNHNKEHLERLWRILSHPDTAANLFMIGKSYGDGAIKVEPRSLEKLPVPESVIEDLGMSLQLRLFDPKASYQTTPNLREPDFNTL